MRRQLLLVATSALAAAVALPGAVAVPPQAGTRVTGVNTASAVEPAPSTWAGSTEIESHGTVRTPSDGDLWPSCWAQNGNLYTTNGDGKGFSLDGEFSDIAVSEVVGEVDNLTGKTVAKGDDVGKIWNPNGYNRKPTGMVCIGDTLYLAVQDLALDFNDVPAATILKSTDHGRTWTYDKSKPMFDNHVFTTIWFADYGRGGAKAPDGYVYAYGLDGNWRDSFDDTVADPQDLFLARVPKASVQNRSAWQFYSGTDSRNRPQWSSRLTDRRPVLTDQRRLYEQTFGTNISNLSVLSQGGVTYLPKTKRYLYTSWTEYTFEFYESPAPWGPWKRFMSKDFSGYPWNTSKYGGYGVTIPSKFVAPDEKQMYVQANVCPCGGGGIGNSVYNFNLRKFTLTPSDPAPATNLPDASVNLAAGAAAISKSSASGSLATLNDGNTTVSENDFDDEVKTASWWGYTWPAKKKVNRVEFTSGAVDGANGGWFTGRPRVQIKKDGAWVDAGGQTVSPAYPGDATAGDRKTYTLTFLPAETDGVRVYGVPGGSRSFTSVSEVAVSYVAQLADGGFEAPSGGVPAWDFEGGAAHGVDRGLGFAHSGANNGWIRTNQTGWSASTQQVPVQPGKTYTFAAWARSNETLPADKGAFGVRQGSTVLAEKRFGPSAAYVEHQVTVTVPAGVNTVTVYAGFEAPGVDTWIQLDDFTIAES